MIEQSENNKLKVIGTSNRYYGYVPLKCNLFFVENVLQLTRKIT
jgi:hypothetical protein